MRIAIGSDWHIGLTDPKSIEKMLRTAKKETFDIWLLLGDYCGGKDGAQATKTILRTVRRHFPDTPIVAVLGNHDLWSKDQKLVTRTKAEEKIEKVMTDNAIHFLDRDGIYQHPNFPHHVIIGHTMWYALPHPPTNDKYFLPVALEGDTDRYLWCKGETAILDQAAKMSADHLYRICATHFPLIETTAEDEYFCSNDRLGKFLQKDYSIDIFVNGHTHGDKNGPVRYECGSDYRNPKYKIISV